MTMVCMGGLRPFGVFVRGYAPDAVDCKA